MLITSTSDIKLLHISSLITGKFNKISPSSHEFIEVFNQIKLICNVNERSILENFSALDRVKFSDIIILNISDLSELSDTERHRAIRLSIMSYIYDKSSLIYYTQYTKSLLNQVKQNIISSVKISNLDLFSTFVDLEKHFKEMIFEDLILSVSRAIKDLNENFSLNENLKHISSSVPEKIDNVFSKYLLESIIDNLKYIDEFNVTNILEAIENITKKISSSVYSRFSKDSNHSIEVNANILRQRESLLNTRESEIDKKEKSLDELVKKNMQFSLDLQKKVAEIDSKFDELAVKKSEIEEMMRKLVEICRKVLKMSDQS